MKTKLLDFPVTKEHKGLKVLYMGTEYTLTGVTYLGFIEVIDSKGVESTKLRSELKVIVPEVKTKVDDFKRELKELLTKYNAGIWCDLDGDSHCTTSYLVIDIDNKEAMRHTGEVYPNDIKL